MAAFKIGAQDFISLSRPTEAPGEEAQAFSRAGVDGYAIFKTGVRGKPFQVQSVVDATDVEEARATYRQTYIPMKGTVVVVRWNDTDMTGTYLIQDVELQAINRVFGPVGGLAAGHAVLRCTWTLLNVT